ncbi:MAG: hypothetical protein J0L88_06960 [Xanthomonadales bacterium]|nr:hypothetical protein [Xanthomonadales bacterium]
MLSFIVVGLAACARETDELAEAPKRKPQQAGQPLDPVRTAGHIAGARVAAIPGNQKAAEAHVRAIGDDIRRSARMPDVFKRIDPESARAAVRPLPGVKSVVWMDRENLIVMVDGQRYRTMEMIDAVCLALEPLGDTLAVVVNLQDATARNGDEAMTLPRNCQLAEGERAFMQKKRQVDVVDRETRETFKKMQGDGK